MPFGLANAPATFQRWMNDIFGDLRYNGVLIYLDDILIHAATEDEFVRLFCDVIDRLEKYGACLKLSKGEIARRRFDYLGHSFTNGTRSPLLKRVEVLQNVADATCVKDVQSILGMFNFYRLYIPNFADKAKPLTTLLKKGMKFLWGDEQRQAVKVMADCLSEAVLRVSPTGQEFRLETDASDLAVGAVLYDKAEYENSESPLPIMFLSKTLNQTEQNWSTQEREAYAINLDLCGVLISQIVDVLKSLLIYFSSLES